MALLTMPVSTLRNNSAAIKRLQPGAPGTKHPVERFGDALRGVRYRHDPVWNRDVSTVELIVDERPAKPEKAALIRVARGESELRQRIKEGGSAWHPECKLWLLLPKIIKALKLEIRMLAIAWQ